MLLLGADSHDRRMILKGAAFATLLLLPIGCTALQFVHQADKRQMEWQEKVEKRWQQLAELSLGLNPEMSDEELKQVEVAVWSLADDPKRSPEERKMLLKLKVKIHDAKSRGEKERKGQ
jgi:hypothetical protein